MLSLESSFLQGAVDGVDAITKGKVWQITKSKQNFLADSLSFYQCAKHSITRLKMNVNRSD